MLGAFVFDTIRSITEKSFLNCYNTVIIRVSCYIYIVHSDCKSMLLIWTASITAKVWYYARKNNFAADFNRCNLN